MKINTDIIASAIAVWLLGLIAYGTVAFIVLDPNPLHWTPFSRGLAVTAWAYFSLKMLANADD